MMEAYAKRGWIEAIDHKRLKNLKHIIPRWAKAFAASETHGVPYFWGNLGIAYREDLVDKPPASWMDLYKPDESLRGRIVMNKTSRDLIGMALKALGYSANSVDRDELRAAERLLMHQKPFVRAYSYVSLNAQSAMVSGEVAMAMMYSGDALMLMEHHPKIRFVLPKEGGNLWVDYLTVAAKSSNKALAYAFIDFLNEPQNAAQLAQFVYYATPNKAAEALLPEEHLTDPVIYPSAEVLSRSEPNRPLPARTIKLRNEIFSRVTR
jgi:spermidine/putrescine transport system substrate-binding protein